MEQSTVSEGRWIRGVFALVAAGLLMLHGATAFAEVHPNSAEACALPPIDGDSAWMAFRASKGLPRWTAPLPTRGSANRVIASPDGQMLLLAGPNTLALLQAPNGRGKGGALIGLTDRRYGAEFIRPRAEKRYLASWELCIGDATTDPAKCLPNGKVFHGSKTPGRWSTESVDGREGLTLSWSEVGGDVSVAAQYQIRDDALYARIRVEDAGKDGRGIVYVRFPNLPNAGRDLGDAVKLVVPRDNVGISCEDCKGFLEYYPRHFMFMPWFGYLAGDHGLYVGAHDPAGNVKRIRALGPQGTHHAYFELYPESSGAVGNSVDPSWWFVLQPLCADRGWPVLTHVYRQWVTQNTPWGQAPRLHERTDIPQALRDGVWWFNQSIRHEDPVTRLRDRANTARALITEGPTAHHWYSWHAHGMDRGFPDFKAKPGTAEAIASVQEGGDFVFPYTNAAHTDQSTAPASSGRLNGCDPEHSQYPRHWESTMTRPDGRRPFGKPASGACLVRMNPLAPEWRETVKSNVRDVTETLGARGVYLDVVGNVYPGSWETNGHAPGLGSWLAQGERDLLRYAKPAHAALAVEGALEQMTGIASVNMNYRMTRRDMVPLFSAVYHDRAILAGMPSLPPDDHIALAIKNGLATVWGMQPGLNNLQPRLLHGPGNASWANRLLRARLLLKDWLAYGEFIRPLLPGPSGVSTHLTSKSWCDQPKSCKPVSHTRRAIEAVLYRSSGGVDRVIYLNMAQAAAEMIAKIPPHLSSRRPVVYEMDGTRVGRAPLLAKGNEMVLRAPGRTVRYVDFEADASEK